MKKAPKYVTSPFLSEPELSAIDCAVWWALCSFAEWIWENGVPVKSKPESCFPTMKATAERARCSLRAVADSIARLEALGHVTREHHFRSDGGQTANYYTLKA